MADIIQVTPIGTILITELETFPITNHTIHLITKDHETIRDLDSILINSSI